MKRCIIILSILLSFIFGSVAYANEEITAAVKQANDEIFKNHGIPDYFQMVNDNGKSMNSDRWQEKERHLFAYGFPYGDTKETPEGMRYRYLGETMSGEEFTNPHFPHDEWREGLNLENFRLYREPWKEVELNDYKVMGKDYRIKSNRFNGKEIYLPSIQRGLEQFWADAIIGKDHPMWDKWHQFVHILQPPTQKAWGLGVAFHKDSQGIIWYIPIPMVPLVDVVIPDLKTNLETDTFQVVKPGDKITSTVAYSLNADHPRPERAWIRLHHVVDGQEFQVDLESMNGAPVPDNNGYITINPGETKIYKYTITVQSTNSIIRTRVNPVDSEEDKNWDNNRAEAVVILAQYDIAVEIIPDEKEFYTDEGSAEVWYTVKITRKDDVPGDVLVSLTVNDSVGTHKEEFLLGKGFEELPYTFNAPAGSFGISAEAWPVERIDTYPPDNRDEVSVAVIEDELHTDSGIRGGILR